MSTHFIIIKILLGNYKFTKINGRFKYLTYSVFRKSYRFWENECSDCNQFGNDNYPFCNMLNNTPQIRNAALYNLVLKLLETILPLLFNFFKMTVRVIIMSNFVTLRE